MSAIGPKQTCPSAPHTSPFGGKADLVRQQSRNLEFRKASGVRRSKLEALLERELPATRPVANFKLSTVPMVPGTMEGTTQQAYARDNAHPVVA
jgi:hypothetical protein